MAFEELDARGLHDEPANVEVRTTALLARGAVWDVREDTFAYGTVELTRHYVDHPGAVGIVALDEQDRVLLVQQYRHPIAAREWELPAGLMDMMGEPALTAAQRELAEEADLAADTWHLLVDTVTTPGGSTDMMRLFLARDLKPIETDYTREAEEADMRYAWVALDEVVNAALQGNVQNGALVHGVLAAKVARDQGWAPLRDPSQPWERRQRVRGERSKTE